MPVWLVAVVLPGYCDGLSSNGAEAPQALAAGATTPANHNPDDASLRRGARTRRSWPLNALKPKVECLVEECQTASVIEGEELRILAVFHIRRLYAADAEHHICVRRSPLVISYRVVRLLFRSNMKLVLGIRRTGERQPGCHDVLHGTVLLANRLEIDFSGLSHFEIVFEISSDDELADLLPDTIGDSRPTACDNCNCSHAGDDADVKARRIHGVRHIPFRQHVVSLPRATPPRQIRPELKLSMIPRTACNGPERGKSENW